MLFSVASYRSYWKGEKHFYFRTSPKRTILTHLLQSECCFSFAGENGEARQDLAKMKPSDLPPTYHGHAGKEDSITRDQSVHQGSKTTRAHFFMKDVSLLFFAEINLLRTELEKCKTILTQHKNLHYLHMVSHFISTVSLIVFLYWQTGISYVVN